MKSFKMKVTIECLIDIPCSSYPEGMKINEAAIFEQKETDPDILLSCAVEGSTKITVTPVSID